MNNKTPDPDTPTYLDFEELMRFLLKVDPNDEETDMEEAFFKKYKIDPDNTFQLIKDILPLCAVGKSPLTDNTYQGLVGNNSWLIKQKAKFNG